MGAEALQTRYKLRAEAFTDEKQFPNGHYVRTRAEALHTRYKVAEVCQGLQIYTQDITLSNVGYRRLKLHRRETKLTNGVMYHERMSDTSV